MPFKEVSVDTDIRIRCNADPEFRNAWAAKRKDKNMKYTSAEAAKLLKRLKSQEAALITDENRCQEFNAAMGEDIESVRPPYDYEKRQEEISEVQRKIRKVKHAISTFNLNTVVYDGMTIDEILVYLPQLTDQQMKLHSMMSRLPKQRAFANSQIIDYSYANYDVNRVKKDFEKVSAELAAVQNALDLINNIKKFEIDVEI